MACRRGTVGTRLAEVANDMTGCRRRARHHRSPMGSVQVQSMQATTRPAATHLGLPTTVAAGAGVADGFYGRAQRGGDGKLEIAVVWSLSQNRGDPRVHVQLACSARTSAPGLDPAHRPGTGTSAPGLGAPLPHLHRDGAHPCHLVGCCMACLLRRFFVCFVAPRRLGLKLCEVCHCVANHQNAGWKTHVLGIVREALH